jgi:hypothetical protein
MGLGDRILSEGGGKKYSNTFFNSHMSHSVRHLDRTTQSPSLSLSIVVGAVRGQGCEVIGVSAPGNRWGIGARRLVSERAWQIQWSLLSGRLTGH